MPTLAQIYRTTNILSIDVSIGAAVCAAYFIRQQEAETSLVALCCLSLSVWIIYTCDHLLDAVSYKSPATTIRHQFHQRFFWELVVAVVCALVGVSTLLFFLEVETFEWGLVLLTIVVIYFFVSRYLNLLKEITIALVYSMGVFVPVLSQSNDVTHFLQQPTSIGFFIFAMLNLMIFSLFEMEDDIRDGVTSFAVHFGKERTRQISIGLMGAQIIILAMLLLKGTDHRTVILYVVMLAAFVSLISFPGYFGKKERYRLLGDGVFLFPLLSPIF